MIMIWLLAYPAWAVDIIFPGSQPKVSSGAGQTTSRGPSAIFYNPANLIMTKFIEPSLDLSFASITYTYRHTNTEEFPDPAVVKVNTPLVTAGIAFRPIKQLSIGVAFLPTGNGAVQLIPNVPQEIVPKSNSYQLVSVENKQTSSKTAAGLAFRPIFPLSIGLGVIRSQELIATKVYLEDEEEPIVDALYGGAFMQFAVGIRSEIIDRAFVLTTSYRTAVTKKYKGDIARTPPGSDPGEFEVFEGVGYAPATIGLGIETRIGSFGLFGEFLMEQWSAGRTVIKRGLGLAEPPEKDLKNTNNFAGGIKFWLAPKHMIELSAGLYAANVGDGLRVEAEEDEKPSDELLRLTTQEEEENPLAGDIAGIGFGDLEAIPRMVFGGGYRAKLQGSGYLQLGAHYQKGSRQVPEGFDGEGSYDLTVLLGTLGLAYGF